MKKIALVCFLALTVFTVQAQFRIIPKVGVTASTVGRSQAYKDASKQSNTDNPFSIGFSAGAGFELSVGDIFSIQPEILYTQKGYKLKDQDGSLQFKLNYVEIPVLLKFSFGEEDELRFFGYAGPYVGYALNGSYNFQIASASRKGKLKFAEEPANYTGTDAYVSKDEANRLDIGAYVGAGVGYPLGSGELTLEGRYGYGFTNFEKDATGRMSADDLKSQNRTIGVFLGYAIPLGGN